MIDDFIEGFEAAANLVMRHDFESPEDMRHYLEIMLDTIGEKRSAN